MHTLTLEGPGILKSVEAAEPGAPAPGEALVRVHRIGVCGTDIHAYGGKQPFFTYPRILGHELGVEVVATGDGVTNVKPGDRCSLEPYVNCQKCIACRRGHGNCCTSMQVIGVHTDGGMRERFVVPAHKLHPSAELSYEQLALVEPLGIGAHAVERVNLESDEFALVIGAGPIGLATMQFALEKGAQVIVLDINDGRLAFCQKQLGVPHAINGLHENVLERLAEITGGDMPTAVFDATGSPRSMMASFDYPAHGGRLVFVGLFQGEVTFNDPNFHKRELTLMASRNAHPADFPRIIDLIESGRLDTNPWITHRGGFNDVPQLFPTWTNPETGVIKAMIEL
ncbi:2-desacetyl-2-hydroxyethyl bacteriochlorophyllide A dehydrogenase [Haloferula luteola]|uniref:2-desacetyl-2-hydroxyethyl bacteriochlorophyllide A dehydrogenase n=1 Tax=Haloferula luteola TaxID=595692 RepID=A0A840UY85_9BACT|nr:zinc-binding alcohol dehydrogenase family protein [Haloferula luteola]MBB5349933.1 2-desacetyl-2-hydroxyethyl bacteriochlorophyllide A dehydrogenase [Haloferula luteola]